MKKRLLLPVLLLLLFGVQKAFCQYPIPSYNVTVISKATFQESQGSTGVSSLNRNNKGQVGAPMAKREMDVKVNCSGISPNGTCQATVWVYSLDGQTILGPFTVYGGDVLSVPIDERDWGVLVSTDDNITVDVWIGSDYTKKPLKLSNNG
jgi:hypothetical protein